MDELLGLLPTLVCLARTESISGCARALGVPRSTVTRRFRRIESLVGTPLAERGPQRLVLTPAGRRWVAEASETLARLTTAREELAAAAGDVRGRVRVASPPGLVGSFVGAFLGFLIERHPEIDVELVVTERAPLRPEDGFDLVASLGAPNVVAPAAWVRRKFPPLELGAVASPSYLARRGRPRRAEDLSSHTLLSLESPGTPSRWPRHGASALAVTPRLSTNDVSTLREAVTVGAGIALLPAHLVVHELGSGELERVLPTVIGGELELYASFPPERRHSPVLRAVLGSVDAFVKESGLLRR